MASIKFGIKTKTVIRLIAIPFARARPRSDPMPNRIKINAKNPITVVSPLARMEFVDLHNASIIASLGSDISRLHSSNLCIKNTE